MSISINDLSNDEMNAKLSFKGFRQGSFIFANDNITVYMGCIDDFHGIDIKENPSLKQLHQYEKYEYARIKLIKK